MGSQLGKLARVPPATLRNFLRSCGVHPKATTDALARAAGTGSTTATRALLVLQELDLIQGDDSAWVIKVPGVNRTTPDNELDNYLRDGFLAYRPFELICEGLMAGENLQQASRHASVALSLDSRAERNLALLAQWGAEFLILTRDSPPRLLADLEARIESNAALPVSNLTSVAETRLYISSLLGRRAFDQLDEIDRTLLVTAAQKCEQSPSESVEAAGQALEDYLRELCGHKGLSAEAKKLSGAGQLGALLRQHDIVHPHHLKIIDAASMLRNAKAHKKDKQTVRPWQITPLGAQTAFGATMLAIRSIHEFLSSGGQEL